MSQQKEQRKESDSKKPDNRTDEQKNTFKQKDAKRKTDKVSQEKDYSYTNISQSNIEAQDKHPSILTMDESYNIQNTCITESSK